MLDARSKKAWKAHAALLLAFSSESPAKGVHRYYLVRKFACWCKPVVGEMSATPFKLSRGSSGEVGEAYAVIVR